MKSNVLGAGVVLAVTMVVGCGPGLSHRAQAPNEVFEKMDAELSQAIGTTTLTGASMPLPQNRSTLLPWNDNDAPVPLAPVRPLLPWDDGEKAAPILRTWADDKAQASVAQ